MAENYDKNEFAEHSSDDVFSKPVRAGKRTYFFDVKATRGNDLYITLTESRRRIESDGRFTYEKHKVFLYREDFEKFIEGLKEVMDYVCQRSPEPPRGPEKDFSGAGEDF